MLNFAFLIMHSSFNSEIDRASIHNGSAMIIGVKDLDDACSVAREICNTVDAIEVCGAFEEAGCKRIIEATEGKIPVGYVTHLKEQDSLFAKVFGQT